MSVYQVNSTGYGQLLVNAGDGPTLIINRDLTNTLLISDSPSVNTLGIGSNTSLVDPLGSITVDGVNPVYGGAITGTIEVDCQQGATNWSPSPAQIAEQISALGLATLAEQINQNTAIPTNISTTGVPLLNGSDVIGSGTNIVIPGGGTSPGFSLPIGQPAYDVSFAVEIASGATVPWLAVQFGWVDAQTSFDVSSETFYLGCSSSGVNVYGGRGQTKGDFLTFQMVNLDPAKAITVTYAILQNSRIPPRTLWATQAFNGISASGFNTPSNDPTSGQIAQVSQSITNGASLAFGLPLYTGKVKVALGEIAQTARILFRNQALLAAFGTSPFIFDSGPIAASAGFDADISLPNASMRMDVFNTGSAAATFAVSVVAEEY